MTTTLEPREGQASPSSTQAPVRPLGWWMAGAVPAAGGDEALRSALHAVESPLIVLADGSVALGGTTVLGSDAPAPEASPVAAFVPACRPADLGSSAFRAAHGLRYAYVAGAMANGIGSVEIVEAMARAGMLGFFGAAGLPVARIEAAIDRLQGSLGGLPYGFNLIHTPNEPAWEEEVVDLYLRRGVRLVSASAYMSLTLPLVRYRVSGIHRTADGRVVAPNRVIAKVSREEVATHFFSPPPAALLDELVRRGDITAEQARMAGEIPVAQDLTAEADSGGHTDNRPAITLIPNMVALRDRLAEQHGYAEPLSVGAAGGIATPESVAAAFALGADFVLTGSVNQACLEAGTSPRVRTMLAEAGQADVCMAPAADMFEMGVKVQVLKRGTLFAMRAGKLFELYRARESLEALSEKERAHLERTVFRQELGAVWRDCEAFFRERDPAQLERAARDPRHRMALVFRWYLGQSSTWANAGDEARQVDYQVWCGPAMGAFNQWTKGTFLSEPGNRRVETVARNLLHGAAVRIRVNALRSQGVAVSPRVAATPPLRPEDLEVPAS